MKQQKIIRRDGDQVVYHDFELILTPQDIKDNGDESELIRWEFMKRDRNRRSNPFRPQPEDGRVLDHDSIQWAIIERSPVGTKLGEYPNTLLSVKATGIRRTPMRNDPVTVAMDIMMYRSGTTFRGNSGGLYVNSDGVLTTLCVPESKDSPYWDRSLMPLVPLWEPDHDMDWDEIDKADYNPDTGAPARWVVQQGLSMPMRGGAL